MYADGVDAFDDGEVPGAPPRLKTRSMPEDR
jgi:hypothetical protein